MKSTQLNLPQIFNNAPIKIVAADALNKKTLLTGGLDDTAVTLLAISSTDPTARLLQLYLSKAGVDYLLGSINVPANAGNLSSVLPLNGLSASFLPWQLQGSIPLTNADSLKVAVTTAVTSGAEICVVAFANNY